MTHKWPEKNIDSVGGALELLSELYGRHWQTRGHSTIHNRLVPSIDRNHLSRLTRSQKLGLERESINQFRSAARFFFSSGEAGSLRDDFIAMMVLRHYGVPTRLLDWSLSPYVAAYFAVSESDSEDGELWAFSHQDYAMKGKEQWKKCEETTSDRSGDDTKFAAGLTAFTLQEPRDWIISAVYPEGFPRQTAQVGLYTMTARFGIDHALALQNLLEDSSTFQRYIVKANIKEELRNALRLKHGICEQSLFPDSAGAASIALRVFPCSPRHTASKVR